jgi:xanthine/CO dehydrogenase XdhC/CoxF family maturation factor
MVTVVGAQGLDAAGDRGADAGLADRFTGTIGGGSLERQGLDQARRLLGQAGRDTPCRTIRWGRCWASAAAGMCGCWSSAPRPPVLLFGAGHVGQAVARALEPLPFRLAWYDTRPETAEFPGVTVGRPPSWPPPPWARDRTPTSLS